MFRHVIISLIQPIISEQDRVQIAMDAGPRSESSSGFIPDREVYRVLMEEISQLSNMQVNPSAR